MAEAFEARAAVKRYLTEHFAGATVSDGFAVERSVHWWRVTVPAAEDVLLHVSIEVLGDYSADQIFDTLARWRVANALKVAAPSHLVLVTSAGVQEKPWPSTGRA